jgi:hypothetical protein
MVAGAMQPVMRVNFQFVTKASTNAEMKAAMPWMMSPSFSEIPA